MLGLPPSLLFAFRPQALGLLGRELHAPMAVGFLRRWPSLQDVRKADPGEVAAFYRSAHCSSPKVITERLEAIERGVAATDGPAVMDVARLRIESCLDHLEANCSAIARYDSLLAEAYSQCADKALYDSLPGAGPALASRLLAAMGESRDRYAGAESLQRYSGVAPVTARS